MTYGDQLDRPIEKLGFYADLARATHTEPGSAAATSARATGSTASRSVSSAVITPWNIPVELNLAKWALRWRPVAPSC